MLLDGSTLGAEKPADEDEQDAAEQQKRPVVSADVLRKIAHVMELEKVVVGYPLCDRLNAPHPSSM